MIEKTYYWARMTDPETGMTCNVLELSDGRLAYTFGDSYVQNQMVPDDVIPPESLKGKISRAYWAAGEMLRRKLTEDASLS